MIVTFLLLTAFAMQDQASVLQPVITCHIGRITGNLTHAPAPSKLIRSVSKQGKTALHEGSFSRVHYYLAKINGLAENLADGEPLLEQRQQLTKRLEEGEYRRTWYMVLDLFEHAYQIPHFVTGTLHPVSSRWRSIITSKAMELEVFSDESATSDQLLTWIQGCINETIRARQHEEPLNSVTLSQSVAETKGDVASDDPNGNTHVFPCRTRVASFAFENLWWPDELSPLIQRLYSFYPSDASTSTPVDPKMLRLGMHAQMGGFDCNLDIVDKYSAWHNLAYNFWHTADSSPLKGMNVKVAISEIAAVVDLNQGEVSQANDEFGLNQDTHQLSRVDLKRVVRALSLDLPTDTLASICSQLDDSLNRAAHMSTLSDTGANPLNRQVIRTLLKTTGIYDKAASVEGIEGPATTVLRAWFDAICAAADVEDKLLGAVPFELRPATHANETELDCSIDEGNTVWDSIENYKLSDDPVTVQQGLVWDFREKRGPLSEGQVQKRREKLSRHFSTYRTRVDPLRLFRTRPELMLACTQGDAFPV